MKIFQILLALATLSLETGAVYAAMIDNGSYVTDTVTGQDWMKLSQTQGVAIVDVEQFISDTTRYPSFSGFHYATLSDWVGFIYDATGEVVPATDGTVTPINNESAVILVSLLGVTIPKDLLNSGSSQGILADVATANNIPFRLTSQVVNLSGSDVVGPSRLKTADWVRADGYWPVSNQMGSFLVRPSAVPIPGAAWLFGSALIGLTGIVRRGVCC